MDVELNWSARLEEAIRDNLFVLCFQPILPLPSMDLANLPDADGDLWMRHLRHGRPRRVYYEVLAADAQQQRRTGRARCFPADGRALQHDARHRSLGDPPRAESVAREPVAGSGSFARACRSICRRNRWAPMALAVT
jgi:hypothetical protein